MTGAPGPRSGQDREQEAVTLRRQEIERQLARLVTAELVDEHRRSPGGHHSPDLAHVLAYLRQAPTAGKLAVLSPRGAPLHILRISGVQGKPHEDLGPAAPLTEDGVTEDGVTEDGVTEDGVTEDGVTEDVAAHDVFLRRLRALGGEPVAPRSRRPTA